MDSILDTTWPPHYEDVQFETAPWWMTPIPFFGLFICKYHSTTTFLDQRRSRLSSSPMSVVPGMKATSAQVLCKIAMAVANSLLCCDIGGCQIPTDKSSIQCVGPHTACGGWLLLVLSASSICAYQCGLMQVVEVRKLEMFKG